VPRKVNIAQRPEKRNQGKPFPFAEKRRWSAGKNEPSSCGTDGDDVEAKGEGMIKKGDMDARSMSPFRES
jgi:hypothetical protein